MSSTAWSTLASGVIVVQLVTAHVAQPHLIRARALCHGPNNEIPVRDDGPDLAVIAHHDVSDVGGLHRLRRSLEHWHGSTSSVAGFLVITSPIVVPIWDPFDACHLLRCDLLRCISIR